MEMLVLIFNTDFKIFILFVSHLLSSLIVSYILLQKGIEIKTPDCQFVTPSDLQKSIDDQRRDRSNSTENNSRFFVPGITGRFRDQIEKRKLLWQKKQEPEEKKVEKIEPVSTSSSSTSSSRTTKVWEAVNFAQDQDGKLNFCCACAKKENFFCYCR